MAIHLARKSKKEALCGECGKTWSQCIRDRPLVQTRTVLCSGCNSVVVWANKPVTNAELTGALEGTRCHNCDKLMRPVRVRTFKNTFAPNMKNRTMTVKEIIVGLKFGAIQFKALPQEVKDAVGAESGWNSPSRAPA